jgi:C-terminal processing protease CtpA/Prc
VLYTLSQDGQDQTDLAIAHAGSQEQAYARNAFSGGDTSKMPPEIAHEIEGYRRTVWEVPNNFVLFLAQYPTETAHLIYSPTAKYGDLRDEMFRFFDGLFVGSPSGKVTVIAVEKQSKAEGAGLKAGDEILSVGAYPTKDDLLTFASGYAAAKKDATENEAQSYPMTVRGADGTTRQANLALPPRLRGGLMDGFSEKP